MTSSGPEVARTRVPRCRWLLLSRHASNSLEGPRSHHGAPGPSRGRSRLGTWRFAPVTSLSEIGMESSPFRPRGLVAYLFVLQPGRRVRNGSVDRSKRVGGWSTFLDVPRRGKDVELRRRSVTRRRSMDWVERLRHLDSCSVSDAVDRLGIGIVLSGFGRWGPRRVTAGRVRTVLIAEANTGNASSSDAATSRTPPQITRPPRDRFWAARDISSPQYPHESSPGVATRIEWGGAE